MDTPVPATTPQLVAFQGHRTSPMLAYGPGDALTSAASFVKGSGEETVTGVEVKRWDPADGRPWLGEPV